ncbi:MAG: PAS domain S-box protein [Chthoniobacterales bacterium]|nr:PAS domain S-box protein [Chthoniobacterales bacterium]
MQTLDPAVTTCSGSADAHDAGRESSPGTPRIDDSQLWRQLFEAPVAMAWTTLPGRGDMQANRAFAQLFGYGPDEIPTLESWFAKAYPDATYRARVREETADLIARCECDGHPPGLREYKVTCKNGEEKRVEVAVAVISGRFLGTFTDVTVRHQQFEAQQQRENDLRRILDHLPFPVATSLAGEDFDWRDSRAKVTYVNRRFTELLGYTLDDIPTVGEWARRAYPDEKVRENVMRLLDSQIRSAVSAGADVGPVRSRVATKNGGTKDVVIKAATEGGSLIISLEDVTERQLAQRLLEQSEERFRLMFEQAPVAIVYTDLATGDMHFNAAYEQMLGYRRDECWTREQLAARVLESAGLDLADVEKMKRAAFERGERFSLELRLTATDGSVRDVVLTSIDLPGVDCNVIIDLSESKRVLRDLEESGRRLRDIVENAPVPIAYTRGGARTLAFNKAFIEAFGWTAEDVPTYEVWFRKIYPDAGYREKVLANWDLDVQKASQSEGKIPMRTYDITTKDGSRREVELTAGIFEGEIFGAFIDVTVRNRAERLLAASEASLRGLLENAPLGIVRTDLASGSLWVNKEFTKMLGYTASDIPDFERWMQRAYPSADYRNRIAKQWEEAVGQAQAGDGRIEAAEVRVMDQAGCEHVMQFSGILIGGEVFGLCVDLTERKNAEQKLRERQEQLARVGRVSSLGQLAASLAHELEQPLAAILNNAETASLLLQKGGKADCAELRDIVGDILEDDRRAGKVLDRIRSMVQQQRFEPQRLDVGEILESASHLFGGEFDSRGLALEISKEDGLPMVMGDSVLLQQALLNLVLNSLEAIGDRPNGRVHVRARDAGSGRVEISVSDNGGGVPPGDMDKLIEPFHTTKKQGLGMGLPLVHSIIEQHGGDLRFANREGHGFFVSMVLPAAEAEK